MVSSHILALIEGDGIFEERRRIRLLVTEDLSCFRDALLQASITSTSKRILHHHVEIHLFNRNTQSFHELTDMKMLSSSSNCRLRLVTTSPQNRSSSTKLLALPWKEFNVNLTDGSFRINHTPIRIQEVSNAGLGTGLNVWDGSIALAKFLERYSEEYVEGKDVLEVGAGTGLVGIAAALLGAKQVYVTDLEYSNGNLKENIRLNQPITADHNVMLPVEAKILDWFHPEAFEFWTCDESEIMWIPDIILASDVVWIESLVMPLVQTLDFICTKAVTKQKIPPVILMSYQRRSKLVEDQLYGALTEYDFLIESIPEEDVHSERIQIFRISFHPTNRDDSLRQWQFAST
jgi:protein N-lysine methyltransferase METTL21D